MQSRKDLVLEAQTIINDYIKKREFERISAQINAINEYSKKQKFKSKKINYKKVLNYLFMLSLFLFANSVIYLVFFLNFHK